LHDNDHHCDMVGYGGNYDRPLGRECPYSVNEAHLFIVADRSQPGVVVTSYGLSRHKKPWVGHFTSRMNEVFEGRLLT
jgi:hypothetical protein